MSHTEDMLIEFDPALPWPAEAVNDSSLPPRRYQVCITMPDGSQGEHQGEYPDGCAAILWALEWFPEAVRVSARRMKGAVQ